MRHSQKGKSLSQAKIKMLLRQYRMMGMDTKTNWAELARRCEIHASTAKRYIKRYLESKK